MASAGSPQAGSTALTRWLAMLACFLALGLLAWRGAAILTGPSAAVYASPAEAALADVLSPVAGPGLSRISVTFNADGGRTILILLDESAAARRADLERLAPLAAGLIPEQGDRLVIETVTFAGGVPARPGPAAWAELAALAALALIAGALAVLPGQAASVAPSAVQTIPAPTANLADRTTEAPRPLRAVPAAPPLDAAAESARRDPARAAAIVRGWMNSKDEIA